MKNRNNLLKEHQVLFCAGNGTPFRTIKINRNDPCKCGSGKKSKNCCGTKTKIYHSKPTPKRPGDFKTEADLKKEMDDRMKAKYSTPDTISVSEQSEPNL